MQTLSNVFTLLQLLHTWLDGRVLTEFHDFFPSVSAWPGCGYGYLLTCYACLNLSSETSHTCFVCFRISIPSIAFRVLSVGRLSLTRTRNEYQIRSQIITVINKVPVNLTYIPDWSLLIRNKMIINLNILRSRDDGKVTLQKHSRLLWIVMDSEVCTTNISQDRWSCANIDGELGE